MSTTSEASETPEQVTDGRPSGSHFDGDLRSALVAAAVELLAEEGVDGLSVRAIARRVGVSHAAPAHHFPNRQAVLDAVAADGFDALRAHLIATRRTRARWGTARLLGALGRSYAEFAASRPAQFDLMFRPNVLQMDDPELATAALGALGELRSVIAHGQQRGWRPDADTDSLTLAAWALAHGMAVLHSTGSLGRLTRDGSLAGIERIAEELLADR